MPTVALLGCAHVHTPGFVNMLKQRQLEIKVRYVWDPNPARAARWAPELAAGIIRSPARALKDAEVQAVIICSETHRHKKLVIAAARAKKHIFAEKPLGLGAKDSYAMADAVTEAGVLFQTGYASRGQPALLAVKEHLDAGHFGRITRVRGSMCHGGALGGWFDSKPGNPAEEWCWMADPRLAGCGAFGDLGTHMLDILMWFCGEVAEVTADIRSITGRYGACDETGEALIRFQNGVTGTLAAGWVDVANPVTLLVSGTEGHASVINGQLFLTSKKIPGADGAKPFSPLPPARPAGLALFLDALSTPTLPLVSVRQAAQRVAVMEAMYRASAQRRWIKPK